MKRFWLLVFFFWCTSLWAFTGFYRWVDEKGVIHFADSLDKVPEAYRDQAELVKFPPSSVQKKEERKTRAVTEPFKTDIRGRGLDWYLTQKRRWLERAKELAQQIKENEEAMYLLHRGVPKARRGIRTEYGIKLGQGPIIRRWAEYKRLKAINAQLQKELEHARYMAEKGVLKQAARAQAPTEWLEIIRKDP